MAGLMFLGLLILSIGLWRVQIVNADLYTERKDEQYHVTVRIPAVRGKILDSQGLPLADNRTSFTLNLYLEELRELYQDEYGPVKQATLDRIQAQEGRLRGLTSAERAQINRDARFNVMDRLLRQMSEIMGEELSISRREFENHYNQKLSMPLAVMTDISLSHATRFFETTEIPPGFDIDEQPMRKYPFGNLASQTIGHMTRISGHRKDTTLSTKYQLPDFEGSTGLEKYFEEELKGKPGVMNVTVNYLGYRTDSRISTEPTPGSNIHLTIDADIQRVAQEALEDAMPNTRGAAVVMEPSNGNLLALASVPGFDPNDFVPAISTPLWQKYNDPIEKTFRNRCTSERYQPGSVFKIVVAMALLEDPDFDPDQLIETSKVFRRGHGSGLINIKDTAPAGSYNLVDAFKKSSNYYFVETGLRLGREKMVEMADLFGFDDRTSLPIMQGASGILPTDEYIEKHSTYGWTLGRTANLSIGQGEIDVTPLHIAQMMACIANRGKIPKPRLVSSIQAQGKGPESGRVWEFPPQSLGYFPFKDRTIDYLNRALLADVVDRDGTGHLANVPGMSIGGKTGTAVSTQRRTTWFASLAPVEAPRFVVVVMVEDGDSGGRTCAPVAASIYREIQRKFYNSNQLLRHNILTSSNDGNDGNSGTPSNRYP